MTTYRILAGLAVVAVLWKLGDAPCGCAAHNGWVEAFAADGSHHPPGSHEHGEAPEPFFDHACTGPSCSVYLTGDRVGPTDAGTAVARTLELLDESAPEAHRDVVRHVWSGPVDGSTGKLRASLQILQI